MAADRTHLHTNAAIAIVADLEATANRLANRGETHGDHLEQLLAIRAAQLGISNALIDAAILITGLQRTDVERVLHPNAHDDDDEAREASEQRLASFVNRRRQLENDERRLCRIGTPRPTMPDAGTNGHGTVNGTNGHYHHPEQEA